MAKRYNHNLSNYKLATLDMGQLVPVQLQEVLPGDTMQLETSALIRMQPMLAPVMHPLTVRFHHWFVPARFLWDEFEDFITGGPNNDNASVPPKMQVPADAENSILDYMGIPPTEGIEITDMPVRAFNLIYNTYYRDQDLDDERDLLDITVPNVAWRKDYFTTARPWQQKGPDITLPIGEKAPLKGFGVGNNVAQGNVNDVDTGAAIEGSAGVYKDVWANQGQGVDNNIYADLSQSTGVTAVQFREFFALQRYAEARSNFGSPIRS